MPHAHRRGIIIRTRTTQTPTTSALRHLTGVLLACALVACSGDARSAPEEVDKDITAMADVDLLPAPSPSPDETAGGADGPTPDPRPNRPTSPDPGAEGTPAPSDDARITGEDGIAAFNDQIVAAIGATGADIAVAMAGLGTFPRDLALPEDSLLIGVSLNETVSAVQLDDPSLEGRTLRNGIDVATSLPVADVPATMEPAVRAIGWKINGSGWSTTTSGTGTESVTALFTPADDDASFLDSITVTGLREADRDVTTLEVIYAIGVEGEALAEPVSQIVTGLTPFAELTLESVGVTTFHFLGASNSFDATFKSDLPVADAAQQTFDLLEASDGLLRLEPGQTPEVEDDFASASTVYPGTAYSSLYISDGLQRTRFGFNATAEFEAPAAVTAAVGTG